MNSPDVSFVIIEYNSINDINACISSITNTCDDISIEIIVSSNSMYSLEKQTRLKNQFIGTKWVFNTRNGGFAYGMNSGISKACGNAVVILNPDIKIRAGSIRKAYDFLMEHPEVGIIGPKFIDKDGELQDTCRHFMSPWSLLCRQFRRYFRKRDVLLDKNIDYTQIQAVDWVIGAFMMARTDTLKIVGGLDEGYFLYVEDMDWCKRFWDNGFKVIFYPLLEIEYKGDRKSTAALFSKEVINKYSFYHLKSYFRFLRKHGLHTPTSRYVAYKAD